MELYVSDLLDDEQLIGENYKEYLFDKILSNAGGGLFDNYDREIYNDMETHFRTILKELNEMIDREAFKSKRECYRFIDRSLKRVIKTHDDEVNFSYYYPEIAYRYLCIDLLFNIISGEEIDKSDYEAVSAFRISQYSAHIITIIQEYIRYSKGIEKDRILTAKVHIRKK